MTSDAQPRRRADGRRVAVVGGGVAGLFAAQRLAEAGAAVTLFEAGPAPGRKFLLAGRGGLNLTHAEKRADFVARYGAAAPLMARCLMRLSPSGLRAWAESLGIATFVGSSGRVFPDGLRATPLLRAWLARLGDLGVRIETWHRWSGFAGDGPDLWLTRRDGARVRWHGEAVVMALGGASWPRTGSDGAWTDLLAEAGVTVAPLRAANCGLLLDWDDTMRRRFAGAPVKTVELHFGGVSVGGDLVITRTGLEGGPAYALSAAIRDALPAAVPLLDLKPGLTRGAVASRLSRPRAKQSLANHLRRCLRLSPASVGLMRACAGPLPGDDPEALAVLVKALPLPLHGVAGLARAISSSGGVTLDSVDDGFMLRARPGIFVAGEMLDWDAPTGGYLLQGCFSTAAVAADGVLAHLQVLAGGDRP